MLAAMDWQEIMAFAIVAATVALLFWSKVRRRKSKLGNGTPCPHCAAGSARPTSTVVFSARKGERPTMTLKLK